MLQGHPSCLWLGAATEKKTDNVAVSLPFELEYILQGYLAYQATETSRLGAGVPLSATKMLILCGTFGVALLSTL
eukprot:1400819-Amphidinium_carterae.1